MPGFRGVDGGVDQVGEQLEVLGRRHVHPGDEAFPAVDAHEHTGEVGFVVAQVWWCGRFGRGGAVEDAANTWWEVEAGLAGKVSAERFARGDEAVVDCFADARGGVLVERPVDVHLDERQGAIHRRGGVTAEPFEASISEPGEAIRRGLLAWVRHT